MSAEQRADAGRDESAGSDTSHGDGGPDIGGSTSGGDARDAVTVGDGTATRKGENEVSAEDAEQSPSTEASGTPDDLALGTRKTVGLDEDSGAGENPSVSDKTTGGS